MMRFGLLLLATIGLSIGLAGCATQVKPWQKEHLAEPSMALVPDAQEQRFHEHTYTSREGSFGGSGVGGGGCGCN